MVTSPDRDSTLLAHSSPSFYCLTMRIDGVLQLMGQYSALTLTVENFYSSLEAKYNSCPDSVKHQNKNIKKFLFWSKNHKYTFFTFFVDGRHVNKLNIITC